MQFKIRCDFNKNKPFWIIWECFSSAQMCFSVVGHRVQNLIKVDLSLKINFFQNFRSRFGSLVKFYTSPGLEVKNYAHGQELLIFGIFFEKLPTVPGLEIGMTFFL